MAISSSKITTAILEVNDVSFKWYVAGVVLGWLVDWISKGWLEKVGVSVGGLALFALVSGALKLLYHVEDVIYWLNALQNNIRSEGFLVRVLARSIFFTERILNVAVGRVLTGKTLVERLPALVAASFLWLLIVYLALLIVEELKEGFMQAYFHVELNILFVLVIFLGAAAIVLNQERKAVSVSDEHIIPGRCRDWKEYGFIGILSAVGAGVAYLKLKEFGWIGIAVAILAGSMIALLALFSFDRGNEYAE